ncbi:Zzef1 [Symbiodinium sp. CCMP2592]|nr:Zzef1 [Symbiodinium sp. CCMP2592]
MQPAINLLVVGECGDGKSTLIDALRDKSRSSQPLCGKSPHGVTKNVMVYPCSVCGEPAFSLVDTPGVGDHGVTTADLVNQIEHALLHQDLSGGIRGVLVTTPVPDGRIRLGAQVVRTIVDKGFLAVNGHDKFANVILVGTKTDKADEEEKKNFMHGLDGQPSVQEVFFQNCTIPNPLCVMVSREDYSPLFAAIRQLPALAIQYRQPPQEVLSQALAETLGTGIQQMQDVVESQRVEMEKMRQEALQEKERQAQEAKISQERMRQLETQAAERRKLEREEQQRHDQEMQEAREVAACRQVLHRQECQSPRNLHLAQCDGCMQFPICGPRFKCTLCPDYDLCYSCFRSELHGHIMLKVHKGIACDGCLEPLLGRRYMCTVCIDFSSSYDLCHECFSDNGHHHKMLEVHQGMVCDGCGQRPILGERFECMRCSDFSLCQSCQRRGVHSHHEMHLAIEPLAVLPCRIQ